MVPQSRCRPSQAPTRSRARRSTSVSRTSSTPAADISIPTRSTRAPTIGGGTVGGPIRRNKLFYFGSWERNSEHQGFYTEYTVPTAKMRAGDFSEVLAINPNFKIYDPTTGTATGANRTAFDERDHSRRSHQQHRARRSRRAIPMPNNPGTNNGLQNNVLLPRQPEGGPRQLRRQGQLEPHGVASDLGEVLDDAGQRR